jgi:hypothetical protein
MLLTKADVHKKKQRQEKYYLPQFLHKEHPNLLKNADTHNHQAPL